MENTPDFQNEYRPEQPQQPLFPESRQLLPNATAVLVLGILSIVLSCVYVGLVLGIIGLVLSGKGRAMYKENPSFYDGYSQLNAGWIMSIIGTCLSGLMWLYVLLMLAFVGSVSSFSKWH
ncbi:CCC motif membrane protein [Flaviaesturariibacter aridisoli]|uniref:DUF4190 domain-containing protein n=1 Tax=Flaviaesturariibacter aridisoli TaxID=2545761 RepID=A0A4R4E325_9BACT|nr:CCC motif membrane protein [Flaviaesturariibacter aridisoli]RYZ17023.1 MAG: DUF4190 domain-containing protein [Chitinophagaceae bacterium]TCZ73317.1 DUF4190 domain-containing protein [Flaviaesturariibacter aridisoli]